MDAVTISVYVALIIALLALLVALAQVLQQYFVTGQRIRLCDSIVYGALPGRGRRVWVASQFRFKVVYTLPQIMLDPDLWPPEYLPEKERGAPWSYIAAYSGEKFSRTLKTRTCGGFVRDGPLVATRETRSSLAQLCANLTDESGYVHQVESIFEPRGTSSGEASWASFAAAAQYTCGQSMQFKLIENDADRCPSDLTVVPMRVSMRDLVVMAFMTGMRVTRANFKEGLLSMQGPAGSITSSKHPVLGSVVHFTPNATPQPHGLYKQESYINGTWLERMWDICTVAGRGYTWRDRKHVVEDDGQWVRALLKINNTHIANVDLSGKGLSRHEPARDGNEFRQRRTYAFVGTNLAEPIQRMTRPVNLDTQTEVYPEDANSGAVAVTIGPHDGVWSFQDCPQRALQYTLDFEGSSCTSEQIVRGESKAPRKPMVHWMVRTISRLRALFTRQRLRDEEVADGTGSVSGVVEEVDAHDVSASQVALPESLSSDSSRAVSVIESGLTESLASRHSAKVSDSTSIQSGHDQEQPQWIDPDRWRAAQERENQRRSEIDAEQRDQEWLANFRSKAHNASASTPTPPPNRTLKSITMEPHYATVEDFDEEFDEDFDEDGREAWTRQSNRDNARQDRERARESRIERRLREKHNDPGLIGWLWASQMDVLPGSFVTSWSKNFRHFVCIGLISVVHEALLGFVNTSRMQYVPGSRFESFRSWIYNGKATWPSYGQNARGGVVVSGNYTRVKFDGFASPISRINLLHSLEYQVRFSPPRGYEADLERLTELMALDSWLSIAGRTPEIFDGNATLLRTTPALIKMLMDQFEEDFENIERTSEEGGLQEIQDIAGSLMDVLGDERLSVAEQTFVLVALLRTAKIGLCIALGPDTGDVRQILEYDVQVWLA